MQLNDILSKLNDVMYTYVLIIMLVGVGIYFTIRTRGVQLRLLKDGLKTLIEKSDRVENEDGKKRVSSFQALMISTASPCGHGKYCRDCNSDCSRRPGSSFLDVVDGCHRRSFCICGKYPCSDLQGEEGWGIPRRSVLLYGTGPWKAVRPEFCFQFY